MVGFLEWKHLSKAQILSLEIEIETENIRRKLEEYMNVNYRDSRKRDIAVDFHLFNYAFCKNQAFDSRRTSTFMSIMTEVFTSDAAENSPIQSRTYSFQNFEKLLLEHSIERSPISIQVFSESDVRVIMKYVIDSYYRQYNLYKYVFSSKLRLIIKQVQPQGVEKPSVVLLPLNSAFEVHIIPPSERQNEDAIEQ